MATDSIKFGECTAMTDYLFAKPTFLGGMSRALDLGGTLNVYNDSPSPDVADALALKSDWMSVGQDLWNAVDKFGSEHDVEKS